LLVCGDAAGGAHWRASAKRQLDFIDLKGAVDALRIPGLGFRRAEHPAFALAAEITSGSEVIGLAGQLSTGARDAARRALRSFLAQSDLEPLLPRAPRRARYSEIDKYPAVSRDIAMIVPEALSHFGGGACAEAQTSRSCRRAAVRFVQRQRRFFRRLRK
jgi:phenylalanyl-tRNA synthetase beta chain